MTLEAPQVMTAELPGGNSDTTSSVDAETQSAWDGCPGDADPADDDPDPATLGGVLDSDGHDMARRPCRDCGRRTGSWCDGCQNNVAFSWPFCTDCEETKAVCHRCRGQQWCTPPIHGPAAPRAKIETRVTLLEKLRGLVIDDDEWRYALGQSGCLPSLETLHSVLARARL